MWHIVLGAYMKSMQMERIGKIWPEMSTRVGLKNLLFSLTELFIIISKTITFEP
jgi:hypothetical protein